MLSLDHLTIIAPSLDEGVEHVRDCLDIDVPFGAVHPEMGTHNHRLRLGENTYLEIIAVDPVAPAPQRPRWFGLDRTEAVRADWTKGIRLKTWVARSDNIDELLGAQEELFGGKIRIGGFAQFSLLADGSLPMGGLLPSVIDRAGRSPPSRRMKEQGVRLSEFILEHPSPGEMTPLYEKLGIHNGPHVMEGPTARYLAKIDTQHGIKTLS